MQERSALLVPAGMAVGDRVRLARIAKRRTVAEMAAALGMSKGTYERIEHGSRPPRRGELIAIAQLTDQDLEFFGASLDEDEAPILPSPLPLVNGEAAGS